MSCGGCFLFYRFVKGNVFPWPCLLLALRVSSTWLVSLVCTLFSIKKFHLSRKKKVILFLVVYGSTEAAIVGDCSKNVVTCMEAGTSGINQPRNAQQ